MNAGGNPHQAQTRGTWRAEQQVRCRRREHRICLSCKDVRDAKRREGEWKKSSENTVPSGGRKKCVCHGDGASSGGRAEREAPCHCMWHRSVVTTGNRKVRRMRENASPGARRERDVTEPSTAGEGRHRTKPLVPEVVS